MGYAGELEPMMRGEITAINPSFPQGGAPTISITGYDHSHRLRHNQPSRFTFKYMNDSAIAAQIAAENLLIPVIDPAPMPPRESVQQTGSDWALLKELAERNFFQVYVYWDKLYFRFPRPQTEMVTLEWGKNLSSFSPRLSTSAQFGIQIIRGYDYKLAQEIVAVIPAIALGSDLDSIIERLGSSFIDQLVKLGRKVIRDQPVENYIDATILAKSLLKQLLDGLYEGAGSCVGIPTLRAGDQVRIAGIGKRFSGTYTLSKVIHTVNEGGYQTRFEVTQKTANSLLQSLRKKIAESPSPNRQERANGTVVGIVRNNIDPKECGRIQVYIPSLGDENLSNWARMATPMAGGGMGMYFLPDVGDEVLVTFEQGDINRPIIVGSVWNGVDRPPEGNLDGLNRIRAIRTRAGHTIILDDTAEVEQILIQDSAGSTIRLQADGSISIEAATNLELSAANGNINLNAKNVNVTVSEAMDVSPSS
jgi:phage protein D/phage baseplate assembly protein gpV